MMFEQDETGRRLREIVKQLTGNTALHEDLIQEAFIHLWLREAERPGQSPAWYMQSCRFHLRNFLRRGRSVDAGRYRQALSLLIEPEEAEETALHVNGYEAPFFTLVCAHDLMGELSQWLTPMECRILDLLADGLGMREIALRLQVSHTCVIKHRRKIAALAIRLGIGRLPKYGV